MNMRLHIVAPFAVLMWAFSGIAGEDQLEVEPLASPPPRSLSEQSPEPAVRVWEAPVRVYRHPAEVLSLAFRPDGLVLATGDAKGRAWLWSVGRDGVDQSIEATRKGISTLSFSRDGSELALGGLDGMVHVWNLKTMKPEIWLDKKHRGAVTSVAYSNAGDLLISAGDDASVWVRDVVTGKRHAVYFGHSAAVTGFGMAPEGLCIISGSTDRTLQSWSVSSGKQVDFSAQSAKVTAVAMAMDGRKLATATSDEVIEIRRTDGCRMYTVALRFLLHNKVYSMAFSRDGRKLYSTGFGPNLVAWDLDTGFRVEEFRGHSAPVTAVAVSSGGGWLATASEDRTVRLWKIGEEATAQAAPVSSSSTLRSATEVIPVH